MCLPSITRGFNHSTHDRETKQGFRLSRNLYGTFIVGCKRRRDVTRRSFACTNTYMYPQTFSPFVCGYDNIGAIQTARSLNATTRRETPRRISSLPPRPTSTTDDLCSETLFHQLRRANTHNFAYYSYRFIFRRVVAFVF